MSQTELAAIIGTVDCVQRTHFSAVLFWYNFCLSEVVLFVFLFNVVIKLVHYM